MSSRRIIINRTKGTYRTESYLVFTLFICLITPVFSGFLIFSDSGVTAESTDDLLYWPQFQKNAMREAVVEQDLRGIQDPVINWDLGMNVISMATTSADFLKNGLEDDGYDRDVWHLLFSAEDENGNMTIFIVDGETGETVWALDMGDRWIEAGPVVGNLDDDDALDIVFASTDGEVFAYEPQIDYDPLQGEGDRYSWDSYNIENDKLWVYETEDDIWEVSPLLTDLTPNSGDSTMDVVITTRFSDTHFNIYALEGNTPDSSGSKLWESQLEGRLPSSPSSLIYGNDNYVWIACYDDDDSNNPREYLYALKGRDGVKWTTISEQATRGTWDLFIPSPVIADIDGDDELDVVLAIPMDPGNTNEYGTIYVYNLYGEPLNEWKTGISVKGRIGATPVVGDLKGDGKQYIVVQAWYFSGTYDASTVVTVMKRDGSKLWSKEFNTDSDMLEDIAVSSPVLYDMDGNGKLDVIAATNPRIFVFNGSRGTYMEGFSPGKKLDDDLHELYDSPCIGDFDKDGIFDIAIDSVMITHEIAELEVADLWFSTDDPEAGEEINIYTDVYNNGTKDTANVVIRFLDENKTIMEDTHRIRAGETAENPKPRVEGYEVTEGWHTFKIMVDPDNEIEEVDKTNNVLTRRIFVAAPYAFEVQTPITQKSILPQSTVSFRIQIENTGTRADSYSFQGTGLPGSWDFEVTGPLEGDKTLALESGETENITVDIQVPTASAHTVETLTFNITSENSPRMYQVDLTVRVLQDHDVSFEVEGESHKHVSPGGEVRFDLIIMNTGNGIDNYTLEREEPPEDWEALFNIINIRNVAPGRTRDAYITLYAPEVSELNENNQNAELTLTVRSKENESATETVEITAEIAQLVIADNNESALPGENASYLVEIYNKEEGDTQVELSVTSGSNKYG